MFAPPVGEITVVLLSTSTLKYIRLKAYFSSLFSFLGFFLHALNLEVLRFRIEALGAYCLHQNYQTITTLKNHTIELNMYKLMKLTAF